MHVSKRVLAFIIVAALVVLPLVAQSDKAEEVQTTSLDQGVGQGMGQGMGRGMGRGMGQGRGMGMGRGMGHGRGMGRMRQDSSLENTATSCGEEADVCKTGIDKQNASVCSKDAECGKGKAGSCGSSNAMGCSQGQGKHGQGHGCGKGKTGSCGQGGCSEGANCHKATAQTK